MKAHQMKKNKNKKRGGKNKKKLKIDGSSSYKIK